MALVLNDAQAEAVEEAYSLAIKYLVTAPTSKDDVEQAMAEIIVRLDEALHPRDQYGYQEEMFGCLLAKWSPVEVPQC